MLKASQFVPIAFGVTLVGFDLTKSLGRLAARLLTTYGDEIDDELGLQSHVPLQVVFRDRGILTVNQFYATFEGEFEPKPNSNQELNLSPIH